MYKKNSHIHFVGIGGIGMSGIATVLKHQGYTVSGCDADISQETVLQLKKLGCAVYQGNNATSCDDITIDTLVYIPMYATSIPEVALEIDRARQRNIPTTSRAQILAELMRAKYSIAIAGSHGKTTTTSLISHILISAKLDPTVLIGGQLKNISSNAQLGTGDFLVAEADESDKSFLELNPTLAVITNIDLEHLETYRDLDDIKESFKQFINNLPFYGAAVICADDMNIRSLLPCKDIRTISYAIDSPADLRAQDIILNSDYSYFTVYAKDIAIPLGKIMLPLPGKHNVYNALGAIALAQEIGISFTTIAQSLQSFAGIERRFSFCGTYKGAELFDDYGHHPVEIENTLLVARRRAKNKVVVVFQPHRYSRTEKLWSQFLSTFATSPIDTLIITDIHSAGEPSIENISSERLAQDLQSLNPPFSVQYVPFEETFDQIKDAIASSAGENDLVLFLGAGKVYRIAYHITE